MFYSLMASNYKEQKNTKVASELYNYAFCILPNRMYPLYSLMLLYDESGEHDTAVFYADSIIKFHPKVESYMTELMKKEAQNVGSPVKSCVE